MRRALLLACLATVVIAVSFAQFKSQVQQETQVSLGRLGDSSPFSALFGWFNPDKFSMRHSFDVSYTTVAGRGFSLSTYTNSMRYEFADNLNARADISMSFSPFGSLPMINRSDLNGIYLSRAEVNYKPWENVLMQVQFRQMPYNPWYSPYYDPFYRERDF